MYERSRPPPGTVMFGKISACFSASCSNNWSNPSRLGSTRGSEAFSRPTKAGLGLEVAGLGTDLNTYKKKKQGEQAYV